MAASQSSFGAQTYGHGQSPDKKTFWFSVIAVVGCFLLFIAVMFVAYIPPNSADSSGQSEVVQARLTRLEELRAKEATAAGGYSWVNQPKGVVRIPIERAVALLPSQLADGKAFAEVGGAQDVTPVTVALEAQAAAESQPADAAAAQTQTADSANGTTAAEGTAAPAEEGTEAAAAPAAN